MALGIRSIRDYLLGELLHLANCRPPFAWKYEFYILLKDPILSRYGTWLGRDLQHIRHECYGCNGTGRKGEHISVFERKWFGISGPCPRCNGTGTYREFWTNLNRYRLGRHEFHIPLDKFYSLDNAGMGYLATIEGYIRHEHARFYLYAEAVYWLALLFNRPLFFKHFGKSGYPAMKFTPMVVLATWIFNVRSIPNALQRRWHRFIHWLQIVNQKFCRHDFGPTQDEPLCIQCQMYNPNIVDDYPF